MRAGSRRRAGRRAGPPTEEPGPFERASRADNLADRRYTGGMSRTAAKITAPDGVCPASLFVPDGGGGGPWPGVLMYMDGVGMRPALYPIAQRIADAGYAVLLPDLFYRAGPYEPPEPKLLFS